MVVESHERLEFYPYIAFASSALYLQRDVEGANAALRMLIELTESTERHTDRFYWFGAPFTRIISLYGNGRGLDAETEAEMLDFLWRWSSRENDNNGYPIPYFADPDKVWNIWFSENHEIMRNITSWHATLLLSQSGKYAGRVYPDGLTAAEQHALWNAYFIEYLAEHAKRGLFVETFSPGYSKWSLHGIYNLYDFAADERVKQMAGDFLTLWWADWAVEQLDRVKAGGKSRAFQGVLSTSAESDSGYFLSWFYMGTTETRLEQTMVIRNMALRHTALTAVTSAYRWPDIIHALATEVDERERYEFIARRPGFNRKPSSNLFLHDVGLHYAKKPFFYIDIERSGSVGHSYVTPAFIASSYRVPTVPHDMICAIHSQARWQGIIFRGERDLRIFPEVTATEVGGHAYLNYHQHRAVQHKGTIIVQKPSTSLFAHDPRVYFAEGLERTERDGWVFVEAPLAFAAVRVVLGDFGWDDPLWLRAANPDSPIIFEVAEKNDYADFAAFQQAVLNQSLTWEDGQLDYTSIYDNAVLTLFAYSAREPQVNGETIDFNPPYTYQSPYLHQDWAGGLVTIRFQGEQLELDFRR